MSNNYIRTTYPGTVRLYAMVRDSDDLVYYPTDDVFETYGTSARTAADYAITLTDRAGALYTAEFPETIAIGIYSTLIFLREGATPADPPTDDVIAGPSKMDWRGSAPAAEAVDETTATTICSLALLKLGEPAITSIYEGSDASALCLLIYPRVRNEVLLRIGRTSFADLGAALSGDSLIAAAEWLYQFDLPSDCVVMLNQTDEGDQTATYPYKIMRGVLLTNNYSNDDADSAYIEYIHLEENTATYKPMQIEAIATFLAAELAPSIKGKAEFRERLLSEYELDALPGAQWEYYQETYVPDVDGETSWLDARSL